VLLTIYPGSARRFEMYEGLRDLAREAKARGLVVGGFGTIMGRNVFQRPEAAAKALLARIMDVFAS